MWNFIFLILTLIIQAIRGYILRDNSKTISKDIDSKTINTDISYL